HWLVSKKRIAEAEQATATLLRRMPPYPQRIRLKVPHHDAPEQARDQTSKYKTLFSAEHRSATFFASVPWFLQDLGTYGIGIFTPIILATTIGVNSGPARNLAELIQKDIRVARGAARI